MEDSFAYRWFYARGEPVDARSGFSDRQAGPRKHRGSHDFGLTGAGGVQFEHTAAGALQHRMGHGETGWRGDPEFRARDRWSGAIVSGARQTGEDETKCRGLA